MTKREGYGRGHQGQWWMQEVAHLAPVDPPKVSRRVRLPSRIVDDGWWLVEGLAEDVAGPGRSGTAATASPVSVLERRATLIFQRRSR